MKIHRVALQVLAVFALASSTGYVWAQDEEAAAEPVEASPEAAQEQAAQEQVSPEETGGGLDTPADAESFPFEAEVHRMLDIVVNSLYQNKDVFLRELISNASDALDKIRYLILTDPDNFPSVDAAGNKIPLEVKLEFDEEARTITIRDTGIGMTHDDMLSNLGTVARSGTTRFLEALGDKGDSMISQIGQFGVGFYSAFLVADRVTVASRHPASDAQYVWDSLNGEGEFKLYKDPRGDTLPRGTEITLYLKEDCLEYAQEYRMSELAKHYSEFVQHPIYIRATTTMEVPDDEDVDADSSPKDDDDEDLELSEDEDIDDEEEPKMKTITTQSWERVNENPALWTREKESITDDDYQAFWHSLSGDEFNNATTWVHFNAEGNINFKSILYLPEQLPDSYKMANVDKLPGGMKLYVRRVLISDEFDLMPRYLGFVRGVVDSDDLPLNVNRETLQESKIISVIRKKLVRKTLEMIKSLQKDEKSDDEEEVEIDADGNVIEQDKEKAPKESKYLAWYERFAPSIKLGVIEDEPNRGKLTKLLRFKSSKSNGGWIGLEDYIKNKKEWQDEIYVMAGMDAETVEKSPFLDPFKEKDVEVLYLIDPIDEYMFSHVKEFDGHKVTHISSSGVKFKDEDQDLVKRREKAYTKQFKPLTKWLKKIFGTSVSRVTISKRLGASPAIVSSGEYGHSANMERIMRAQALQNGQDPYSMKAMKILEINPRHPLVLKLLDGCPPDEEKKDEEEAESFVVEQEIIDAAWILHDMAMLNGGFPLTDPESHAKRLMKYLQSSLEVPTLDLEPEIDPPIEEDDTPGGINVEKLGYGGIGPDGNIQLQDFDGEIPDIDISVG